MQCEGTLKVSPRKFDIKFFVSPSLNNFEYNFHDYK